MTINIKTKNRGAISNPEGRFETHIKETYDDGWEQDEVEASPLATTFIPEAAKTIITRNDSPDLSFNQSINPYRGCEHGCIYCYARPSHAYMNLSPGLDFETKIFYKVEAALRLREQLSKKNYQCETIVLGANTDPYQPVEAKLKITRSLLDVLNEYQHPVSIITKNTLIERDIDLLSEMAKKNLVSVAISITSMDAALKRILEPRTSLPSARFKAVQHLTEAGIPVRIMAAPMIPMINDVDLEKILAQGAKAGAKQASYVLLRLPHEVKTLFYEWLKTHFPERAEHVMSLVRQMRAGKEYDSTFGERMVGTGKYAALLSQRFKIACKRFHLNQIPSQPLDTSLFLPPQKKSNQFDLWENQ